MFNRETGKYRVPNPMGDASNVVLNDALHRKRTEVTPVMDDLINRLVTVYNNKAYGNPIAPMIRKSNLSTTAPDGLPYQVDTLSAWTKDDNRLGFLSRDNDVDGIRYGVGIDNGSFNSDLDRKINTPFGTLDYGHDAETAYAGFTPNDKTQAYIQALANLLSRR